MSTQTSKAPQQGLLGSRHSNNSPNNSNSIIKSFYKLVDFHKSENSPFVPIPLAQAELLASLLRTPFATPATPQAAASKKDAAITEILEQVKRIGAQLEKIDQTTTKVEKTTTHTAKISAAKPNSWAAVAAAAAGSTQIHAAINRRSNAGSIPSAAARVHRTITVRIEDPAEREGGRRLAETEQVKRITRAKHPHAAKVVSARRLPSGDLHIVTDTPEARKGLEDDTTWTKVIAKSAKVLRRSYPVMAHGIRVKSLDTKDNQAAVEAVTKANLRLHGKLDITAVKWPKGAQREGKTYSSLIIELGSPEHANRLLDGGMVLEGIMYDCSRFRRDARVTQCYRCQGYGHIARACRNDERCAHCAGKHDSAKCENANDAAKAKCAACGKAGHKAWTTTCPVREKERDRARAAFVLGAQRYETTDTLPRPPRAVEIPDLALAQPTPPPPPPPAATVESGSEDELDTIVLKQTKRRKVTEGSKATESAVEEEARMLPTPQAQKRKRTQAKPILLLAATPHSEEEEENDFLQGDPQDSAESRFRANLTPEQLEEYEKIYPETQMELKSDEW